MSPIPVSKIREWLAKSGYPFELQVGRHFSGAGWSVAYSSWYTDVETGKSRELDIHAQTGTSHTAEGSVHLALCVECKRSTDKPWVGFASEAQYGTNGILTVYKGALARMAFTAASTEGIPLPDLLPPETPRVGGLVQFQEGTEDPGPGKPYHALLQARSSVRSLDLLAGEVTLDAFPGYSTIAIRLPLVVVDAQLFTLTVAEDSTEILAEVDAVAASVPGDESGDQAIIPVITARHLPSFAQSFISQTLPFCKALIPHLGILIPAYSIDAAGLTDSDDDVS